MFQYISCYSLSIGNCVKIFIVSVSIHLMLLFIQRHFTVKLSGNFVSIHLMLLFINEANRAKFRSKGVSIHLMLLFINKTGGVSYTLYRVSIHLMLLFIGAKIHSIWPLKKRFNTSHVTLYLVWTTWNESTQSCFNTSHVTLYHSDFFISMYGYIVSIHLMLLFICLIMEIYVIYMSFNTSHVTLYQFFCWKSNITNKMFQYISCYSLSMAILWCIYH